MGTTQKPSPSQRSYLPVKLINGDCSLAIPGLIDSGSDWNLICSDTVKKLGVPLLALDHPLSVQTLDGSSLNSITQRTTPVFLISGNHSETIVF